MILWRVNAGGKGTACKDKKRAKKHMCIETIKTNHEWTSVPIVSSALNVNRYAQFLGSLQDNSDKIKSQLFSVSIFFFKKKEENSLGKGHNKSPNFWDKDKSQWNMS